MIDLRGMKEKVGIVWSNKNHALLFYRFRMLKSAVFNCTSVSITPIEAHWDKQRVET